MISYNFIINFMGIYSDNTPKSICYEIYNYSFVVSDLFFRSWRPDIALFREFRNQLTAR
jgi:hypothetical protein